MGAEPLVTGASVGRWITVGLDGGRTISGTCIGANWQDLTLEWVDEKQVYNLATVRQDRITDVIVHYAGGVDLAEINDGGRTRSKRSHTPMIPVQANDTGGIRVRHP